MPHGGPDLGGNGLCSHDEKLLLGRERVFGIFLVQGFIGLGAVNLECGKRGCFNHGEDCDDTAVGVSDLEGPG